MQMIFKLNIIKYYLYNINMFENPITFALLVSSLISLIFYLFNRDKDKKNHQSNMKYVLIFGIVFILGLIGKILFNESSQSVENILEESISNTSNDISIDGGDINDGSNPPF